MPFEELYLSIAPLVAVDWVRTYILNPGTGDDMTKRDRKRSDELCEQAHESAMAGNLDKAAEWISQAVKFDDQNPGAWRGMFRISMTLDEYEKAIHAMHEYLKLTPDDFKAWSTLGSVLKNLGRFDEAQSAHLKATTIQPDEFGCWYNLGVCYEASVQLEKAKAAYERAVSCDPQQAADAYYNLGNVLFNMHDLPGAVEAAKKSIEINPHDPDTWDNLALMQYHLHEFKEAELSARKALEIDPHHPNASGRLGTILLQIGDHEGAQPFLKQSTLQDPANPISFFNLAKALKATGDDVEATRALLIAEELGVNDILPKPKKIVTKRCSQFNHPEFVLYVNTSPILEECASFIANFLEEDVASGSVYKVGETVQIGWMITKLYEEDGHLCVCEPHFVDMPIQWVNSVTKTTQHLLVQQFTAESVGLSELLDPPSMLDLALVCKRIGEDKSAFFVERVTEDVDFPTQTGWFVECRLEDCCLVKKGQYYIASLYELATKNPAVIKFLALPRGISVEVSGNQVEFMYMEKPLELLPDSVLARMRSEPAGAS